VTGLIYIVIIALWAAVLIPMWLRRHDQISEVRSTARFENSMARLGSHDQNTGRRGGRDHMNRHASMSPSARRRAIILASLTGLTALTLLLALVSIAPKWMPIVFGLLTAAFMVASAMTASARTQTAPTRVRRTSPSSRSERTSVPVAEQAAVEDDWETWNAWDDEDDAWEAVPTTLPTYVTAPRASQVPRPIDKARPGEWTGSAWSRQRRRCATLLPPRLLRSPPSLPHTTTSPQRFLRFRPSTTAAPRTSRSAAPRPVRVTC
jgi:hypothetical protein